MTDYNTGPTDQTGTVIDCWFRDDEVDYDDPHRWTNTTYENQVSLAFNVDTLPYHPLKGMGVVIGGKAYPFYYALAFPERNTTRILVGPKGVGDKSPLLDGWMKGLGQAGWVER